MADPTLAECDPELLTLWISRRVNTEALPGRRVVVEFRYHGERPLWAWLVLEPGDISVCLHDPCLPVDLTVRGHPRDLYRVYSGRSTLAAEISAERIELDGLPAMRRAFPSWMAWSPFAPAMRQAVVSVDQMPEAHGG